MKFCVYILDHPAYLICLITILNAWALSIFDKHYRAAEAANKPIFENPDAKPREKSIATMKNGLNLYRQGIITCWLNVAILLLCAWWLLSGAMPDSRFEIFAIAILPTLIWNFGNIASDLWRNRKTWRALRMLLEMAEKEVNES